MKHEVKDFIMKIKIHLEETNDLTSEKKCLILSI